MWQDCRWFNHSARGHPFSFHRRLDCEGGCLCSVADAIINCHNRFCFLLGVTEELADVIMLQTLMSYSLSDIPDMREREKSLTLMKHSFVVLQKSHRPFKPFCSFDLWNNKLRCRCRANSGLLVLPRPLDIFLSLVIVVAVTVFFLARYRPRRPKVHWNIMLLERAVIVTLAVIASLLMGGIA